VSGTWDNDYQGDWSAQADAHTPEVAKAASANPSPPPGRGATRARGAPVAPPPNSAMKTPEKASPNVLMGAVVVAGLLAVGFYVAQRWEKEK